MKTAAMNTDNEDNDNWSMSGSDMPSALGLVSKCHESGFIECFTPPSPPGGYVLPAVQWLW